MRRQPSTPIVSRPSGLGDRASKKSNRGLLDFTRSMATVKRNRLRATHRAFHGETAEVILAGTLAAWDAEKLSGIVKMLFENDYAHVVIDVTRVRIANGGLSALLRAMDAGARLMVLDREPS